MKKITICGSMKFFDEMEVLKSSLEEKGYEVFAPIKEGTGVDYSQLTIKEQSNVKQRYIDHHLQKIKDSDAIIVANYDKNKIKNYIGANSFIEMAFAYAFKKDIYILNGIPDQPNTIEIRGMKPIVLDGVIDNLYQ